jgi:putative membrane protein
MNESRLRRALRRPYRTVLRVVVAAVLSILSLGLGVGAAAAAPIPQTPEDQVVLADGTPIAPNANGALPPGWRDTQWGPLGPADIALLEGVRRANIWEGEGASVMGMQKGQSQRVREVGKILQDQHRDLETALVKIAAQMQVPLPTQPNAEQQGWLGQMSAASGPEFDRVWVDILRAAHGKIFSLIATVRANTRNSLVRDYAIAGNAAVLNHMKVLESTGLVEFNTLPTPAAPAGTTNSLLQTTSSNSPFIWVVLAIGVLGCAAAGIKIFRTR